MQVSVRQEAITFQSQRVQDEAPLKEPQLQSEDKQNDCVEGQHDCGHEGRVQVRERDDVPSPKVIQCTQSGRIVRESRNVDERNDHPFGAKSDPSNLFRP